MDNKNSLERFIIAQSSSYNTALKEIKAGRKRSHWIWYIFPQITGLGISRISEEYAIKNLAEAKAYIADRTLGPRLLEISEALAGLDLSDPSFVMGFPDDLKLRSSMTLFAIAAPEYNVFQRVLDKYYGGEMDKKTIEILRKQGYKNEGQNEVKIRTERLLLRPLTVADANEVFEWASDERVSRYMVYTTYTDIVQVKEWLAFVEKDTSTYNFGFERLSDGKLIGSGDIGKDSKNGYWGFGYNLRYDCWNNGYATEAVKAMIEYVRKNFGATHFTSSHAMPNLASGHVMEKCGLHFTGYGEFQKLDGSCKMKSMEYKGEF